jgi:hypothetical protein
VYVHYFVVSNIALVMGDLYSDFKPFLTLTSSIKVSDSLGPYAQMIESPEVSQVVAVIWRPWYLGGDLHVEYLIFLRLRIMALSRGSLPL